MDYHLPTVLHKIRYPLPQYCGEIRHRHTTATSFALPFVLERWRYKFPSTGRVTINCLVHVSARGRFRTEENKSYKIVSRETVCDVERPLFVNYFFHSTHVLIRNMTTQCVHKTVLLL